MKTHALSLNSGDLVPPWHCGLRVAAFDVTFAHHPSTAGGLPCNESLDSILSVETAHVHVEFPQRVSTLPSRATEFVISQESPSCLHPASTGKLAVWAHTAPSHASAHLAAHAQAKKSESTLSQTCHQTGGEEVGGGGGEALVHLGMPIYQPTEKLAKNTRSREHAHPHARTRTDKQSHTTQRHARTHTRKQTHAHACTRTHTHAHARTRTQAHIASAQLQRRRGLQRPLRAAPASHPARPKAAPTNTRDDAVRTRQGAE